MSITPHVLEAGQGEPVVLLHAFPLNASMWLDQRNGLRDGWRVLTPDQRGFGGSQLGHDEPSLDVAADDVAALLDTRGITSAVIGGLSMGGYVAMAFLRRHPERVRALVLADTRAGADSDEAREKRLRIADEVVAAGSSRQLADDLLPALVGDTTRERRPLVLGRIRALVENAPASAVAWAQRAMAARPSSEDTLRAVTVPTLVIAGEEDALSPVEEASRMASLVPGAVLEVLPAAGHLSAIETPDAFNAVLRSFLQSL